MSSHSLRVKRGTVIVYLAYDIGREVKLELAERKLRDKVQRPQLSSDRRQPKYFGYDPLPVRFTRRTESVSLAGYHTEPEVDCTIWDFGALTLAFKITIPPETPIESLISLAAVLDETDVIETEGYALTARIAADLGNAVISPVVGDTVEDFIVFRISELNDPISGSALFDRTSHVMAQIVRAERVPLSDNVVHETLKYRVSYRAVPETREDADLTLIGWNAALTYAQEEEEITVDDLCAVFEFVLTYLLEMRLLDEKLDDYLDEAYSVSLRRGRWFTAEFSRVGLIQIDAAMLFEAVHNALKLVGDEFLAEVQRVAAERFGFDELDRTLRRKLNTLQGIYEKLADRRAHRRSETLEVIIIILILLEILLL